MGLLDFLPMGPDPTGGILGGFYDQRQEQGKRISGLLSGIGSSLLNPSQLGGGTLGDIGRAVNAGRETSNEAGTGYLNAAYSRKIKADEIRRKQYVEDQQVGLDERLKKWAESLSDPDREIAMVDPAAAHAAFLKSKYANADDQEGYYAPVQVQKTDAEGNPLRGKDGEPLYELVASPKKGTGPARREDMKGRPAWDSSVKGETEAAQTKANENTKKLGALPNAIAQTEQTLNTINDIKSRPDLQELIGMNSLMKDVPGTPTTGLKGDLNQLSGQLRQQALVLWKGMGQFTEAEGQAAVDAASGVAQAQNWQDFQFNLAKTEYYTELARRRASAQLQGGDTFIMYSATDLMGDRPYPKRSDYLPKKAETPAPGPEPAPGTVPNSELEEAVKKATGL